MTCPIDNFAPVQTLPHFPVEIAVPDLSPWLAGNAGIAGVHRFVAAAPGPHVAIIALMHGNEIAGAAVLDELLREGPVPACGQLSIVFANIDAFARFDPAHPTASRFLDEDMNRLWDTELLDGPRQSRELARARALRPLFETTDVLLDLHSMLWPSEPLILCGTTARGRELGRAMGTPGLVVADCGHVSGRRLIDFPRFGGIDGPARGVLVEAGQHWHAGTIATTRAAVQAVLALTGLRPGGHDAPPGRVAEVTRTVTAATAHFTFLREFRGGEIIARRNTVIALDGETEIRTPYDDCLLVMPSLRPSRGHTAVRLARLV